MTAPVSSPPGGRAAAADGPAELQGCLSFNDLMEVEAAFPVSRQERPRSCPCAGALRPGRRLRRWHNSPLVPAPPPPRSLHMS